MSENKKKRPWIPDRYFSVTSFAEKLIQEDQLSEEKALEVAIGYYRKRYPEIDAEKVKEYLGILYSSDNSTDAENKQEPSVEKLDDPERTYHFWLIQKTSRNEKGTIYGKIQIIKATSKKNAEIRCKRMDWDQVGSQAVANGFYVEYKVVSGPYNSKEAANTVVTMCE